MPNVVKSPRAPLNVPVVDVFTFLFGKHLGAYSDKVATVDGLTGESLTFGQIKNNVLLLASGLSKLGVGKGDTVGLFAPNNIEYGIVLVALARLGAFRCLVFFCFVMAVGLTCDTIGRCTRDPRKPHVHR